MLGEILCCAKRRVKYEKIQHICEMLEASIDEEVQRLYVDLQDIIKTVVKK